MGISEYVSFKKSAVKRRKENGQKLQGVVYQGNALWGWEERFLPCLQAEGEGPLEREKGKNRVS